MKYKILFDYGAYEGMKFQDEEFDDVNNAVKHALNLNFSSPFFIVSVVDWEAFQKCPYPDCPKVHYYDCPIHSIKKQ